MGEIQNAISGYLNRIRTAVLGRDVRDSIANALDGIAEAYDVRSETYRNAVIRAENAQTTNAEKIEKLRQLEIDAQGVSDVIDRLDTFGNNLTTPIVDRSFYTGPVDGVWTSGATQVEYDSVNNRFRFTFPKGPDFPEHPDVTFSEYADTDASVTYNPNEALLTFRFPNLIAKYFAESNFEFQNIVPDENNQYSESPSVSYDESTQKTVIKLRQGLNGTGATDAFAALSKRPFVLGDLYRNTDPSIYAPNAENPYTFPRQSLVSFDHVVDPETDKLLIKGANDFDAAIIVFRKTVNNNAAGQLNNNFSWNKTKAADITKQKNTAFLANNTDFDQEVSVVIRKPVDGERMTSQTVQFIDSQRRLFERKVYWVSTPCSLVCSGGAKDTWPAIKIVPDADNTQNEQGIKVGDGFSGAFIFENATMSANATNKTVLGNGPEWSWQALNTYAQTQLAKSKNVPLVNIEANKVYNQCLIPIRIIGISFGASQELVDLYTNTGE